MLTNYLLTMNISFPDGSTNIKDFLVGLLSGFEFIQNLVANSNLVDFVTGLVLALVNPFVFAILFYVLKFITLPINLFFKPKPPSAIKTSDNKKGQKEYQIVKVKKKRLTGALIGVVQGFLVFFFIFIPVSGIVSIVDKVNDNPANVSQEINDPNMIDRYYRAVSDSIALKSAKAFGMNMAVYNHLAKFNYKDADNRNVRVVLSEEVLSVADLYWAVTGILNEIDNGGEGFDFNKFIEKLADENSEQLEKLVTALFEVSFIKMILPEVMPLVSEMLGNVIDGLGQNQSEPEVSLVRAGEENGRWNISAPKVTDWEKEKRIITELITGSLKGLSQLMGGNLDFANLDFEAFGILFDSMQKSELFGPIYNAFTEDDYLIEKLEAIGGGSVSQMGEYGDGLSIKSLFKGSDSEVINWSTFNWKNLFGDIGEVFTLFNPMFGGGAEFSFENDIEWVAVFQAMDENDVLNRLVMSMLKTTFGDESNVYVKFDEINRSDSETFAGNAQLIASLIKSRSVFESMSKNSGGEYFDFSSEAADALKEFLDALSGAESTEIVECILKDFGLGENVVGGLSLSDFDLESELELIDTIYNLQHEEGNIGAADLVGVLSDSSLMSELLERYNVLIDVGSLGMSKQDIINAVRNKNLDNNTRNMIYKLFGIS
jgi:hypothetical protein